MDAKLFTVPLRNGNQLIIKMEEEVVELSYGESPMLIARINTVDEVCGASVKTVELSLRDEALWSLFYALIIIRPEAKFFFVEVDSLPVDLSVAVSECVALGEGWQRYVFSSADFLQVASPWLSPRRILQPAIDVERDKGGAPVRLPKPRGECYRRFDPALQDILTFRRLEIESDLVMFNKWQNDPRVLPYWQEGGTLDDHFEYLSRIESDPHIYSMVACFSGEPFAYIEAYWAKEDRIAPFCEAQDYDRGFHVLVGEKQFLGRRRTDCLMSSIVHYLFLDDIRTDRIVVEPRADNSKVISLLRRHEFVLNKYFDFPHKRAALMTVGRKAFFTRNHLCGTPD
ncbi:MULTISPECIES: GNAT family N-acetyltransferase [Pseudomonas]|jgi:acetyl CoA:N6-hydroxylysine acetyl transferase|uniref:GNAT family N-acetyltransferase n=1 Tax=Pseudomonas TaxID=286 RepID=UPI0008D1EA7B|nr:MULTISPECIES: GNAT family N-acetyltransferase [unclassified Pseudomonas]MBP1123957.1 acetyl CoA:N6-hydroxylysine acetyl transferase [Pseudomonas sp. PvP025]MDQ0397817.1 acetyl CoA:N6-hydroxylysine acetyl transferase [Pseudomonas sp. PvP006]SEU10982.1 Protein N-acetyltransferase, RimJ/RimL family [Pseudomonas sp. NFR09]